MEFSASYDTSAKVITIGSCILFAAVGIWNARAIAKAKGDRLNVFIRILIFAVLVSAVVFSYWCSTTGYETRYKMLVIKKHNGPIMLSSMQIMDARRVAKAEMNDLHRTFGVGGLFGYSGHYHNETIGDMTFYATQNKNWVLVHTIKGESIILTPDDPDKFLYEVKAVYIPNN